jgi:hypothetical protein
MDWSAPLSPPRRALKEWVMKPAAQALERRVDARLSGAFGEPRDARLYHLKNDDDHRSVGEVQARWARDPLVVHGARLGSDERAGIEREVEEALEDCVARVRQL